MSIADLFAKDINRSINGVVKVQDDKDESIRQELEEYVVTRELQRHFATFFEAYDRALDVPTDKVGVWISGFFGSGKSHFLKILSYLLPNREVAGRRALDYFDGKIADPLVESNVRRACSVPTEAILFNIDSVASNWKKGDKAPTALLYGFERMFYEARGFFGIDLKLARLEEYVDSQGKTDEFRAAYARAAGADWLQDRVEVDYHEDEIVQVLQEVLGMSEAAARRWFDNDMNDGLLPPDAFAQKVKDYVDAQAAAHGGNYRLLFMVDEVGQFITNENDTSLMLSLQTLVEELGSRCGGRVWVMVTSQEAIDNLTMVVGNDFSKIQGRFNTRLSLSSSSVDEVIQRRVLEKKPTAAQDLTELYEAHATVLKNHFSFDASRGDLTGYASRGEFVASYPFAGYQFKVLPDVMTEVRKHGIKAKHMSTGERSMLSAFQESAQAIQGREVGALVPFWRFFDTIAKDLEHGIIQVVDRAARAAEEGRGLKPRDVEVLKLLYLIRYIDYVKSSVENISILMIDALDVDKQALKDEAKDSLDRLVRENYVARQGDTYNFLTDEEQEIAREIAQTPVNAADVVESIKKALFDNIYTARKLRRGANDFPFDRYVDDGLYGVGQGGMRLNVITLAHELSAADDAEVALRSAEQALIVLSDEYDYFQTLQDVAKTNKFALTRNLQNLPPTTQQIIQAKRRQATFDAKEATAQLEQAVVHARVAVNGRMVAIRETSAKAVFEEALRLLAADIFQKADFVGAPAADDAALRRTLAGQMDRALAGMDGGNSRAEDEVAEYLKLQARLNVTPTMGDVQRRFQGRPYGWREVDVANVVAALVVDQRATVVQAGQVVPPSDARLLALLCGKDAEKAQLRQRVRINEGLIKQAGALLKDFSGASDYPADEDKLVAAVVAALEDARATCSKYVSDYFTGLKDAYVYPGQAEIEALAHAASEVLEDKADAEALLRSFTRAEDELMDAREDFEPVEEFFRSQKPVFDRAKKFMQLMGAEKIYLQGDASAMDAISKVDAILRDPRPYRRIRELAPLMQPVEDAHKKLVDGKRRDLLDKLPQVFGAVDTYVNEQGDYVAAARKAVADAEQTKATIKNRAQTVSRAGDLDACKAQMTEWAEAAYVKIDAAVEAETERRARESRVRTVTATGEHVDVVKPAAPSPGAPAPAPAPRRNRVKLAEVCPRAVITNKGQVDAYVESLRRHLLHELDGYDELRII